MAKTGRPAPTARTTAKKAAAPKPAPAEETRDDEQPEIELTPTGWVRMPWPDGTVYRLRRPFFGELKDLRMALEDMSDEITAVSERLTIRADEIAVEVESMFADDTFDAAERSKRVADLRLESRVESRKLTAMADELRVRWWSEVFDVLCVDKKRPTFYAEDDTPAKDLPGWIVDNGLQAKVSDHWRSAPLARG